METLEKDQSTINGWGIDADPQNDPTYPIKHRTESGQEGSHWERPTQQKNDVEVLQSIERPSLPAVIGTSTPPSGLSGAIRRYAFKYSESHYGHWLPLLLADRVNSVEGIIDDIAHGKVPNIFAESGWAAQWKYNKPALIRKVAIMSIATVGILAYLNRGKERRSGGVRNAVGRFLSN
jgi:hypothetical protein